MDYRALNNFAWTMGEALKEKVNLAMLSDILRMRFAHYLGEFADDEGFLQMTYQARLQVEQMKDLEKITEGIRAPKPEDKKKDGQNQKGSNNTRRGKEVNQAPRPDKTERLEEKKNQTSWGGKTYWGTKDEALVGVPTKEQEEYTQSREDC